MTEANEGQPLTRRQLRELERAAEAARSSGMSDVPEPAAPPRQSEVQGGRHSAPSVPAAPEEQREVEPVALQERPAKPEGAFFGRRKARESMVAAHAPEAEPTQPDLPETVAMDRVPPAETEGLEVIEAQLHTPETDRASVPAPSAARRSSVQIDDIQGLDTVDDAELDDLEIDEVIVEQPRVSSRRVAESTPAQLQDHRDEADELEPHAQPTGPSRRQSMRLPVIVNVVSDTSEHHIADLRERGAAGEGGGSSTGSITANALVLPAGSDSPEFQLEGDDGLLVTGSIDVPEGFASSGRGRASIDGSDVDGDVAGGEVHSPETAPVRASKAVSSYANARVQIAPQKQRSSAWPIAIGVGAGAFVVGVGAFLAVALTQGWL